MSDRASFAEERGEERDASAPESPGDAGRQVCDRCPLCPLRHEGVLQSNGQEILRRARECTDGIRDFVRGLCRNLAVNALPLDAIVIQADGKDPYLGKLVMDAHLPEGAPDLMQRLTSGSSLAHAEGAITGRVWLGSPDNHVQVIFTASEDAIRMALEPDSGPPIRVLEARDVSGFIPKQPSFDNAPHAQSRTIGEGMAHAHASERQEGPRFYTYEELEAWERIGKDERERLLRGGEDFAGNQKKVELYRSE